MFKKLLLSFLILSFLWSYSLAQDSWKVIEIWPMVAWDQYINYIRWYLLNETDNSWGRNLNFALSPWKEKKVQVKFENKYSKDLVLFVEFHDWEKPTWATDPNAKACKAMMNSVDFPKYTKFTDSEKVIVPANSEITKEIIIKFPALTNWLKQWCMVYWVASADVTTTGWFFSVEFVKENYIDVLLMSGNSDINTSLEFKKLDKATKTKDFSSNPKINAYFDEAKEFVIEARLMNNWSLDEVVNISGTISNIFGYKETFEWSNIKVTLNNPQGTLLTTKWIKSFKIPSYKWSYKIALTVNYKPTFDFDVSGSNIDKKVLEWWTFTEKANIFIMPWMTLVIVVVFLILVKMAFRKRTTDDTDSHGKK